MTNDLLSVSSIDNIYPKTHHYPQDVREEEDLLVLSHSVQSQQILPFISCSNKPCHQPVIPLLWESR